MRAACTLFILKNYYKYKTGFLAVVIKPTALAYTGNNLKHLKMAIEWPISYRVTLMLQLYVNCTGKPSECLTSAPTGQI